MPWTSAIPPLAASKDPAQYPLFKGGITRMIWRIVTQRLTWTGRWFALVSLVALSLGGASIQLQGYVLAIYISAIWAVALLALSLYWPRVTIHVDMPKHVTIHVDMPKHVTAGNAIPATVRLTQTSVWRGADLSVIPHQLPASLDAIPANGVCLPDLAPGQSIDVPMRILCKQRGVHTLRGFRVESAFPFYLLRSRSTFRQPMDITVFPAFTPLGRLNLPAGRRYQPGGVAMASQLGESMEYLGNRDYREGDNPRDIDWRATARAGKPIVREWVEEYLMRAAVLLDTQIPQRSSYRQRGLRRDALERAVSIAAAVTDFMARKDYLVDLFAVGPHLYHLTAGRGLAYLEQVLDILANVQATQDEPFQTIEPQIAELLEQISVTICVLLDWDEVRRSLAMNLHRQGIGVKIVIVRDSRCTLDPNVDAGTFGPPTIISSRDFVAGISSL